MVARRAVLGGDGELLAVRIASLGDCPAAVWKGGGADATLLVMLLPADEDPGEALADTEDNLRLLARQHAASSIVALPPPELSAALDRIGLPAEQVTLALADDDWFSGAIALSDAARGLSIGFHPDAAFGEAYLRLRRAVDALAKQSACWTAAAKKQHDWFGNGRLTQSATAALSMRHHQPNS